jgi:hypothetical protein
VPQLLQAIGLLAKVVLLELLPQLLELLPQQLWLS